MFGVKRITRKPFRALFILLMAIAVAGCGASQGATTENSPSTASVSEEGQASLQESGLTEPAATKVVKDEFGEVEIPVNPKRVMGVYLEDYLTALGVSPVMQWYHPSWGKQDYLNLDVPTFDITGSMEVLLEASPDLIIVDGGVDAAKYEQYSKIAPTYRLPEAILQEPVQIVKKIAELLNMPEKGEEVMEEYTKKMNDTQDKLVQAVHEDTVAVVRLNAGDKTLALFGINNRYTGSIYSEMGLTPHPFVRDMTDSQAILSEEKIPELNADHIIIFPSNGTWASKENQDVLSLLDSPLWKSLPAVKAGHVYRAERTHWQSGAVVANMKKADDLIEWMVP